MSNEPNCKSNAHTVSSALDFLDSRLSELETLAEDLERVLAPVLVNLPEGAKAAAPPVPSPNCCGLACAVDTRRERLEYVVARLSSMVKRVGL